jgi:Xaa-Pro aminopeptidase
MDLRVPVSELKSRMQKFRIIMESEHPGWKYAFVISKINMFYFTGTRQEGLLVIPADDEACLWIRRSYERACDESFFPQIKPMSSFRDAANFHKNSYFEEAYFETDCLTFSYFELFKKYFPFRHVKSMDQQIAYLRSVKSEYELEQMRISGKIHQRVLENLAPMLLVEGMSEVDLTGEFYRLLLKEGHHGIARFAMFDTEMGIGQIGFGVASLYPSSFNGPGGNYGICPAVPIIGSRENKLKKGDLVFADVACGYNGYHTDKTMLYMFGSHLDSQAMEIHQQCVEIQKTIARQLKPGAILSELYENTLNSLSSDFLNNFMGYGSRTVKFLGHAIGLTIDEWPVIARGFDRPIEKNMVFAIEPKKGIENIGMVGIENTFVVTDSGGECITGNTDGLILVVE